MTANRGQRRTFSQLRSSLHAQNVQTKVGAISGEEASNLSNAPFSTCSRYYSFSRSARHVDSARHWYRSAALGECRLAHARAFHSGFADSYGGGSRFLYCRRGRQRIAGITEGADRHLYGGGQNERRHAHVPATCNPPAPATTCTNTALPIFDRELSLSRNGVERDAGTRPALVDA